LLAGDFRDQPVVAQAGDRLNNRRDADVILLGERLNSRQTLLGRETPGGDSGDQSLFHEFVFATASGGGGDHSSCSVLFQQTEMTSRRQR